MNLKEGLKKGIDIYVNEYFKLELGMNIKDYTYELDFEKNWVEFHMPDEPHNSSWLWSSYFSDINEIKDFLLSIYKIIGYIKKGYWLNIYSVVLLTK